MSRSDDEYLADAASDQREIIDSAGAFAWFAAERGTQVTPGESVATITPRQHSIDNILSKDCPDSAMDYSGKLPPTLTHSESYR